MSQTDSPGFDIPRTLRQIGGRHLRLTLVAAALLLVAAGAAGGYASHRPAGHAGSVPTDLSRAGVPAASSAAGASGTSTETNTGAVACPMIGSPVDTVGGDPSGNKAVHLFTRTTADGVTIRSYRLSSTGACDCGVSPSVSLEISDATAVGQGDLFDGADPVATTANATSEPTASATGTFGIIEGAPVWWAAVTVGPQVADVTMTFADGSTDQMTPVDGVVVLAHQIDGATASSSSGPYEVRGTMTLLAADGAVLTTVTFPTASPASIPLPVTVPGSPPTPLKAAGAGPTGGPVAAAGPSNQGSPSSSPMNGSTTACSDVMPSTVTTAR